MIDDEPDMLEVTKAFLEEGGLFEVDTSLSAVDALGIKDLERYDAIVCDYQMPEMDGSSSSRNCGHMASECPSYSSQAKAGKM